MSVLYKALQKAEKENEQRQAPSAVNFDPERLAGSGAIRLAGRGQFNWRLLTLASLVIIVAATGAALYFVQTRSPASQPQVATTVPPSPPAAAQGTAASSVIAAPSPKTSITPTRVEEASVAQAPASTAQSSPPGVAGASSAPPPPAISLTQAGVAAAQAPLSPPAPAASSRSTPAEGVPTQVLPPAEVARPPEPVSGPSSVQKSAQEIAQAQAPAKPAAPRAAPQHPEVAEISPDSPANALSPPVVIARQDFALSGIGRAVRVREVSQAAQDNVGSAYAALLRGEYDTALGFYDQALQQEPGSVLALLGRGAALQRLHRLEDAQASYNKVLKSDPQNREALTNLTAIVAEQSPTDALNKLLVLEKEYSTFSPIQAQIGLIYARMNNMEAALAYLRRAAAQSPESTMYQYNLALVLDHMGLRDQAVQAYETVLSKLAFNGGSSELSSVDVDRRVRFLRAR